MTVSKCAEALRSRPGSSPALMVGTPYAILDRVSYPSHARLGRRGQLGMPQKYSQLQLMQCARHHAISSADTPRRSGRAVHQRPF